ncbi:MAG TPA: helicase-associated domain-containing protein, partial [Anaerolineales bacterium]|nr:helicase-associated domain-containing protein [Anaerolineales bacterium]
LQQTPHPPAPSPLWERGGNDSLLPSGEGPGMKALLTLHRLLSPDGTPLPEPTRAFLESPRGDALTQLTQTWLTSPDFDELRQLPGLQAEGDWKNDPLRTRRVILRFLQKIPPRTWWSLNAFIAAIKQQHPDFQRPTGEYDSWYLKDTATGEFVRGFEHWDDVDGALIRFMLTGPMHALGLMDLAAPDKDSPPTAFRWSGWANALMAATPPKLGDESGRVFVRSDGRVMVPRTAPRAIRYQIARFCQWNEPKGEEFRYRLTPSSLARSREQGLRVGHLITLLAKHSDGIPPNVTKALKDWEAQGAEARVAQVSILRVSAPEILQALRESKAKRFLGDILGPTNVIVKPGAEEKVLAALVEMGYLGEMVE